MPGTLREERIRRKPSSVVWLEPLGTQPYHTLWWTNVATVPGARFPNIDPGLEKARDEEETS